MVKTVTSDEATPFNGERAWDERAMPKMSIMLWSVETTVRSSFQVRGLMPCRVSVSDHVNTWSPPKRLQTCVGLREVKWALGWVLQQRL